MRKALLRLTWSFLPAACLAAVAAFPARADWRDDIGTFRVGMLSEPGAGNTVPGLAELKDAYAKALGIPVEIFVAVDYPALIEAQIAGRVDYAIYSAIAYAAAAERCNCVEPLAAPVGGDRALGIRSVLITLNDRLASIDDLPLRRIAIVSADNVTGRLLPLVALAAAGHPLTGKEPFLVAVASASAADALLQDGSVDAMFGWVPSDGIRESEQGGTLDRLTAAGLDRSRLKVVWRSDILRYGPHAVRSGLDAEPKRRLLAFLLNLSATPRLQDLVEPVRTGGFVAVTDRDYRLAREIVRAAGGLEPPAADPPLSTPSR